MVFRSSRGHRSRRVAGVTVSQENMEIVRGCTSDGAAGTPLSICWTLKSKSLCPSEDPTSRGITAIRASTDGVASGSERGRHTERRLTTTLPPPALPLSRESGSKLSRREPSTGSSQRRDHRGGACSLKNWTPHWSVAIHPVETSHRKIPANGRFFPDSGSRFQPATVRSLNEPHLGSELTR